MFQNFQEAIFKNISVRLLLYIFCSLKFDKQDSCENIFYHFIFTVYFSFLEWFLPIFCEKVSFLSFFCSVPFLVFFDSFLGMFFLKRFPSFFCTISCLFFPEFPSDNWKVYFQLYRMNGANKIFNGVDVFESEYNKIKVNDSAIANIEQCATGGYVI